MIHKDNDLTMMMIHDDDNDDDSQVQYNEMSLINDDRQDQEVQRR